MIFLFHGNNPSASREALRQLRNQYAAAIVFPLSGEADFKQFQEVCEPGALLGGVRLVVAEVYFKEASRRQTSLINDRRLPDYLKKKPESTHVALWFDEELPAAHPLLQALDGEKAARVFRTSLIPPNVFSFLDDLANRRRRPAIKKFFFWQKAGINNNYLLTMIAWQIRRLLVFSGGSSLKGLKPFTQAKLTSQAKNFSESQLLNYYSTLADLDRRGKSGEVDLSLDLFCLAVKITG